MKCVDFNIDICPACQIRKGIETYPKCWVAYIYARINYAKSIKQELLVLVKSPAFRREQALYYIRFVLKHWWPTFTDTLEKMLVLI